MNFLSKIIAKIKKWAHNYYVMVVLGEDDPELTPVKDLTWVSQRLTPDKSAFFNEVDTIEFGIDKMPVQHEVIFEVETLAQAEEILTTLKEG